MQHHPDCDGWRVDHRTEVERTRYGTFVATCAECGPIHPGSFGPAAIDAVRRLAAQHAVDAPCAGQCLAWDDPEYADV